jgi:hypothetical protein
MIFMVFVTFAPINQLIIYKWYICKNTWEEAVACPLSEAEHSVENTITFLHKLRIPSNNIEPIGCQLSAN